MYNVQWGTLIRENMVTSWMNAPNLTTASTCIEEEDYARTQKWTECYDLLEPILSNYHESDQCRCENKDFNSSNEHLY